MVRPTPHDFQSAQAALLPVELSLKGAVYVLQQIFLSIALNLLPDSFLGKILPSILRCASSFWARLRRRLHHALFRCTCKPKIQRDGKTYPPMTGKAHYLPRWATGVARRLGLLWTGEPPASDGDRKNAM
jgi:hypothetical protein